MWTQFMDMHSGGGQKLDWSHIYIEAPKDEAVSVFYAMFGRNPHRVTCTCCGSDYSITVSETLEQATGYERGCAYGTGGYEERPDDRYGFVKNYRTLEEYMGSSGVRFVRASEISPDMRTIHVPDEGYVWAGD